MKVIIKKIEEVPYVFISQEGVKAIIVALEQVLETIKFIRGFGEPTKKEADIQFLIKELKIYYDN